ncbi:MAG: leucyl/phenylalanyl-tRNA--protein transferase [Spirochaetota bacterium]
MSDDFPYLGEKDRFRFPDPEKATIEGIVAAGGNLSPGMLLSAYSQGIFPWFSEHDPILWWSPDPRFVLFPEKLHVSKSMRRFLKNTDFIITADTAFVDVVRACATVPRDGQDGTWITPEMENAYAELHRLGYSHSVEVWRCGELVGGLYGVSLGSIFFGESMFSHISNASKAAFIRLVRRLSEVDFDLIDSQVYTHHLEQLGAEEIPRSRYLDLLRRGLSRPTLKGSWRGLLDSDEEWTATPVAIRADG